MIFVSVLYELAYTVEVMAYFSTDMQKYAKSLLVP